ncbi:MAG: hypothetical protein WDN08_14830 [Rhizomicrobium sp.]
MNDSTSLAVLAIHPTSRGFGWILFEGPSSPFDWGTVEVDEDKQAGSLARVEELIRKSQPDVLALEAFDDEIARRAPRIQRIGHEIAELARKKGIEVSILSRAAIRTAFAASGARTREEIAEAIARHIQPLRHRLPQPRKIWVGEHPSLSIFSAAACALAYYAGRANT